MRTGGSRRSPQKSLRLYARPEYDEEMVFDYPPSAVWQARRWKIFARCIQPSSCATADKIGLSPCWDVAQRLAEGTNLDRQAGRFAVVF